MRRIACRGLLRALYELKPNDAPRFRLHWFTRAVEGVWASLDKKTAGAADDWRTVGKLYGSGDKLIDSSETAYSKLFTAIVAALYFSPGMDMPPDQLPVQPAQVIELLGIKIERLPRGFSENLTDKQSYLKDGLRVFWPLPEGKDINPSELRQLQQVKQSALDRIESSRLIGQRDSLKILTMLRQLGKYALNKKQAF